MNIAVLGSGGREHAIVWKLSHRVAPENIYALPGNGGIPNSVAIDPDDFEAITRFCVEQAIDLIVVGPEAPLAAGVVDYFADSDIRIFGPSKAAARLESSKIWSKRFMRKYGVATADFNVFKNPDEAKSYITELQGNLVIKFDGLAAGKGVYVCSSEAEALAALDDLVQTYGQHAEFLIEEKLVGSEISIIGFTDGKDFQMLLPSQDHKPLLDGDQGPNTGGMGAFCPVPFCDDALMQQIMTAAVNPTLQGIQAEHLDYKGIVYFGLMITDSGPQLLEYNVRLGDPETEVILPAMKSDLLDLILACLDGTLADYRMEFHDGYFVDVVLVSGGYPKKYVNGYEISGLDAVSGDTLVFHAGTALKDSTVVNAGGRVLNIVAHGDDLPATIAKVYEECPKVQFQDVFYRKDIGQRKNR